MDEEKKSLFIEDTDSKLQEKNCPLSVDGWIMLLNSEINKVERIGNQDNITQIIIFVVPLVFSIMAVMLAVRTTNLQVSAINSVLSTLKIISYMLGIVLVFSLMNILYNHLYAIQKIQKKVNSLKTIRENLIDGNLINSNAIRKEWKELIKENRKDI